MTCCDERDSLHMVGPKLSLFRFGVSTSNTLAPSPFPKKPRLGRFRLSQAFPSKPGMVSAKGRSRYFRYLWTLPWVPGLSYRGVTAKRALYKTTSESRVSRS